MAVNVIIWPTFLYFLDLKNLKVDFWIPGKILSEILVRTVFGCLVTLKLTSEATEDGFFIFNNLSLSSFFEN